MSRAVFFHLGLSLRLHFRNRLALLYGYAFPVIFLLTFWALYRHERVPLVLHLGELLTVGVMGGACFGLPTTIVSEREKGVWRRYRATPVAGWEIFASVLGARYILLLTSGFLQLLVARFLGMPWPADPLLLWFAFTCTCLAFLGLGLAVAALADNVAAVQALGQCLFLPMLIVGGVAVPISRLPEWARVASVFSPGRYAVESMQACVTGARFDDIRLDLLALLAGAVATIVPLAGMLHWNSAGTCLRRIGRTAGLLAGWAALGWFRFAYAGVAPLHPGETMVAERVRSPSVSVEIRLAELRARLVPDNGLITPFAPAGEKPPQGLAGEVQLFRTWLAAWEPGLVANRVQRVRNLLLIAAQCDLAASPLEREVPALVLDQLETMFSQAELLDLLHWVALHPAEGEIEVDLADFPGEGESQDEPELRRRIRDYAVKLADRLNEGGRG